MTSVNDSRSREITSDDPSHVVVTPSFVTIDPVVRIEGHLSIQVEVDLVEGQMQVVNAQSAGTLFRGFETILKNRHPWDAIPITERICGVCPVSHAMAASLALDDAAGVTVPPNGRIIRNLVLGANFIQSHLLHFYHLALMDFIEGPDMAPWRPDWPVDRRFAPDVNANLVQNYVAALEMRRKAHEMGAIFGAKLPHPASFVPGGITPDITAQRVYDFTTYLNELIPFIEDVWIPDVNIVASAYGDYFEIGRGNGNLLAYGVFDLDDRGGKLLEPGRVKNGSSVVRSVDVDAITEHVSHSWYNDNTNDLHPSEGETEPEYPKASAYSWLKAPRHNRDPYETGPLARMWVSNEWRGGISVCDRHLARAYESRLIARAMVDWLAELEIEGQVYADNTVPETAVGVGLTEAPRGALGHWVSIEDHKIGNYQVITPTCWNASPMDSNGQPGPIEQALIGTPVSNTEQPLEVLRVVHSFDPCLACAVHVMRPGRSDSLRVIAAPAAC